MYTRGNFFAAIEEKFKDASEDELISTARHSMARVFNEIQEIGLLDEQTTVMFLMRATAIGVSGDGYIDIKEKRMLEKVFSDILTISVDQICELVGEVTEGDYKMVKATAELGNSVAMPLLHYILSFAYIDGRLEDDVAERLESIFGLNLLAEFMRGGFVDDE